MLHVDNWLQIMNYKIILRSLDEIIPTKPDVCIILGSGLNDFCNRLTDKKEIPYNKIDGFKNNNIEGHSGKFIFGFLNNIPILCASGRLHYYEGYTFNQVGIIIKLFYHYKPKIYLITNSSGTVRKKWNIGDFMLSKQIIDFSFIKNNKPEYYLLDDKYLNKMKNINIDNYKLRIGTYTYTIGPTYETKEEIKEIRSLNGDIVGMSTFPEYLMCKKLKINPIILSCITNYAAGIKNFSVKHSHVIKNAKDARLNFSDLLNKTINEYI